MIGDGLHWAVTAGITLAALVGAGMLATLLAANLTRARVSSAAKSAALGAIRQPSPGLATLAAQRAAVATLTDLERFGKPTVIVDVSRFRTAGRVEVTVACSVAPRAIGPIDRSARVHQATAAASAHPSLSRR